MLERIFNGQTMQTLEYGLASLNLRQSVLSNNIANANTPGYLRRDVAFQSQLRRQLAGWGDLDSFRPQVVVDRTRYRLDGNGVDIEAEMARLAENSLLYQAAVRQVSDEFARLRLVISEGRR